MKFSAPIASFWLPHQSQTALLNRLAWNLDVSIGLLELEEREILQVTGERFISPASVSDA